MKVKEVILSSIIFLIIAKVSKLISKTLIKSEYKELTLSIELVILSLCIFIAYHFI